MPPFDDIVPRTTPAERDAVIKAKAERERLAVVAERKKKGAFATPVAFVT